MKTSISKKLGITIALIGLSLASINLGSRIVARNIMSHCGYREGSMRSYLKKPSTYLTEGPYRGFMNLDLATSDGLKRDPALYDPNPFGQLDYSLKSIDLNEIFLGLQKNHLPVSPYKPTSLTGAENICFYSIKDFVQKPERLTGRNIVPKDGDLERILNMKEGEVISSRDIQGGVFPRCFTNIDLGAYTLSFGRDERGIYTSIYDVWDFESDESYLELLKRCPIKLGSKMLTLLGKPIHFYDRFYWDDYKTSN